MRILLIIILSLTLINSNVQSGVAGVASGRILSSPTADRDTIDFGYNMAGNDSAYVYRSIFFVNDGTVKLVVRPDGIFINDLPPYKSKVDFHNKAFTDLSVDVSNTIANPVRYDSIQCAASTFLTEAPEGMNRVLLRAQLSYSRGTSLPDSLVAQRNFVLQYIKTVRPLWATALVNFDSVYVGGQRTDSILFRNSDLKRTLHIDGSSSVVVKGLQSDFVIHDSPIHQFAQDSGTKVFALNVQYTASQVGLDSVRMYFEHYNPVKQATDSTPVILRGVGVMQDLQLTKVVSNRGSLHADTVDVGSFTVGVVDTVHVIFKNNGTLNYRGRLRMIALQPSDTIPFAVVDSLTSNSSYLPVDSSGTLQLTFRPTRVGEVFVRCELRSDIDSRVASVPSDQLTKVFYLRASSRPRLVTALTPSLQFDSVVVFNECTLTRSLSLRVHNSSSQVAIVRSNLITPSDAPYVVQPAEITIDPGGEKSFTISFSPRLVQEFDAQLQFFSSLDDVLLLVPVKGTGIEPRTMPLRLPAELKSFPGHDISIPLLVDASLVGQTQAFTASMSFDSSLLHYDHYDKVGTASAGALQVGVDSHVVDNITIRIVMPETFLAKDTLIRLIFRTSLGYQDRCDVSISVPEFGLGDCAKVMPSASPSTVFTLDSLCGLESKLLRGPLQEFKLNTPSPNPAQANTELVYSVAFPTKVRLELLNSIGTVVKVLTDNIQDKGVYRVSAPLDELSDGVYYVRMSAAMYEGMERLVHTR